MLQDRSYLFSKSDRFDPCDRAKGTPLPFTSQTEYMDCLRQRNNLADKTAKNSVKQPRKMTGGVDVQDECWDVLKESAIATSPKDEVIPQLECQIRLLQDQLRASKDTQHSLEVKLAHLNKEKDEHENASKQNYEALCSMTAKCIEIEEELDKERKDCKETVMVLKNELQLSRGALIEKDKDSQSVKEAYHKAVHQLSLEQAEIDRVLDEKVQTEGQLQEAFKTICYRDGEILELKDYIFSLKQQIERQVPKIQELTSLLHDKEMGSSKGQIVCLPATSADVASDSLKKSFEDDVKYLKKELNVLREEATKWKSKCDGLEQKYKPYQDQIDTLMELNSGLMGQTELAQSEAIKLCAQYAQVLGHHNKKQKIHHVDKLAKENIALKRVDSNYYCDQILLVNE